MKRIFRSLLLFIVITSTLGANNKVALVGELPEFDIDVIQLKSDGLRTAIDIYTSIPLANLNFTAQSRSALKADYEISVDVFKADERGRVQATILADTWERQVAAPNYEFTRSDNRRDVVKNTLHLPAGNYAFQITVTDKNSGKKFTRELPLWIRNFEDKTVALSDILLCDNFEQNSLLINPNVSNVISNEKGSLLAFFYGYSQANENISVVYSVDKVSPNTQRSSLQSLVGQSLSRLSLPTTNVIPEWEEKLTLQTGANQLRVEVPMDKLQPGIYALKATLKSADGTVIHDQISKVFNLRWAGLTAEIVDIDKAIRQLMHIAREEDVATMRNGKSEEQKLALFNLFWERRDPTPSTERNEAMEEFYHRINYVNREHKFGRIEGWQTDQGMVYIRFGEPNYIQRHPFDFGASDAYEIWYYESIGRKFIFIDKSGVGMFELYRPIWDDRNRL